jgi:hypothetical protein
MVDNFPFYIGGEFRKVFDVLQDIVNFAIGALLARVAWVTAAETHVAIGAAR